MSKVEQYDVQVVEACGMYWRFTRTRFDCEDRVTIEICTPRGSVHQKAGKVRWCSIDGIKVECQKDGV